MRRRGASTVLTAFVALSILLAAFVSMYAQLQALGASQAQANRLYAERGQEALRAIISGGTLSATNTGGITVRVLKIIELDDAARSVNYIDWEVSIPPGGTAERPYTQPPGVTTLLLSERGSLFKASPPAGGGGGGIDFFRMLLNPSRKIVRPGFAGTLTTVVLESAQDYPGGDVSLECVDGPCASWGISYTPNPVPLPPSSTATSDMSGSVPDGEALGTYLIETRGRGSDGVARRAVLEAVVADFALSVNPTLLEVQRGGSNTATVTATAQGEYEGSVTLSIQSVNPDPGGRLSFSFDPNPISVPSGGSADSTLTVTAAQNAATGFYDVVIEGNDGLGPARTTLLTVCVYITDPDTECQQVVGDFTVDVLEPGVAGCRGEEDSVTVRITSVNGFSGLVDLSFSDPDNILRNERFSQDPVFVPAGGSVDVTFSFVFRKFGFSTVTISGTDAAGRIRSDSFLVWVSPLFC